MNNWRLLLFALAAVFHPIASFTERNLVDGRQQCCDQLPSPLRDTRSSFHGTHRPEKTTTLTPLRRLNDRDKIHHDRLNELRQLDSVYNLPSTERRLLDIRASGSRFSTNGVESRLESRTKEQNRDQLVASYVHKKESIAKGRLQQSEHLTYRSAERSSRSHATEERYNDRGFETSRDRTFRDDHRTERYGNERKYKKSFDSQREIPRQQIRSGEFRFTLNKDGRHILRQSTDKESRIGAAKNMNRPYEYSVRTDSRRNIDNSHERQQLERSTEQMRSFSENNPLVHQFRVMRVRMNFRGENRENRQRLFVARLGVRYEQRDDRRETRQHNNENTERLQIARRITRESRILSIINNQGERNVYDRQEMGHTRDKIRANPGHRLFRERTHMDRRHNRESKIMSTFNENVDNRRENKNNENSKYERENYNNLLESIQMERTNFRDFRFINKVITRNGRDIDSTRPIRHTNRLSKETRYAFRKNFDQRYSRDMQQRNIRELRIVNTPNESNVDGQRQVRYNEKRFTEMRAIRVNFGHRLPSERVQMNRRQNRESRIISTLNERGLEIRPEIRRERLSRDIRDGISENSDLRVVHEKRQVDRRDIRESRIIIGVNTGNARETESKQEIRYKGRLSRQARDNQFTRDSRVESRALGRVTVTEERHISGSDRRTRSADSRNFRQIRTEPTLSRSAERRSEPFRITEEHRDKIENREREAIEARSRNVEMARKRESINREMVGKVDPENDSIVSNWQYLLYTLQAAYICTLFMQILAPNHSEKPKKINLRWLRVSSHYNPVKVD